MIVGGTGRFASATGGFDFTSESSLSGGETALVGQGWIGYDASESRDK